MLRAVSCISNTEMFDSVSNLFPGHLSGSAAPAVQLVAPSNLVLTPVSPHIIQATWTDPASVPIDMAIELWRSDLSENINSNTVAGGVQAAEYTGLEAYEGVGVVLIMRNNGDGITTLTSEDNQSAPVNVQA